jgi:5S rRNA maturation endonuclease (ribonuclease M5)
MIDCDLLRDVERSRAEELCRRFFPNGKKLGNEWKLGDVSGVPGNSLGVALAGLKAGLWQDRATGEGGDFVKLLCANRELGFVQAVQEIERALGVSLRDESPPSPAIAQLATPAKEASLLTADNPNGLPYRLNDSERKQCVAAAERLIEGEMLNKIAKARGWKSETIRNLALDLALGLTSDNKLAFLYESGLKVRWKENGERIIRWAFGKPWLWRGWAIKQSNVIYVCEGETDAITLIDAGVEKDARTNVIALPSASYNVEPWALLFSRKRVIIATDCDEAGERAAEHVARALKSSVRSLERFVLKGTRHNG